MRLMIKEKNFNEFSKKKSKIKLILFLMPIIILIGLILFFSPIKKNFQGWAIYEKNESLESLNNAIQQISNQTENETNKNNRIQNNIQENKINASIVSNNTNSTNKTNSGGSSGGGGGGNEENENIMPPVIIPDCTLNLTNTTWTEWINISCLGINKMNQTRNLTQYDSNNCETIANQTFIESKTDLDCICTASLTCENYQGLCGIELNNGCLNILNCSNNCDSKSNCNINGICISQESCNITEAYWEI